MPSPTRSQVHVDAVLSAMSIQYTQDPELFAANRFLGTLPVRKKSDSYYIFNKGDFFRDDAQLRAPGAPAADSGFDLSTATYSAVRYASKVPLAEEIMDNADAPLSLEDGCLQLLGMKLNIKRERLFATNFLNTSIWPIDNTGVFSSPSTNQFLCWNVAGSNPREYLRQRASVIQKKIGRRPNRLLLGQDAYDALVVHPDFADLIAMDKTKIVTPELIGQALDIKEVIVAGASYNTAARGQTASMSYIVGDVALMAYVEPSPAINKPSAGYQFSWTKFDGISPKGAAIKKWFDDDRESWMMVGEIYVDMKVTGTDCGEYFTNCVN